MAKQGYLTDDELASIGNGFRLNLISAAWWNLAVSDARKDGINLAVVNAAGAAYRSRALTIDMRKPENRRKYNITPGILPGLPSPHEYGACTDVGAGLAWLIKNGARYHFLRPAYTMAIGDTNHFQCFAVTFPPSSAPASTNATPLENEEIVDQAQEDRIIQRTANLVYELIFERGIPRGDNSGIKDPLFKVIESVANRTYNIERKVNES